MPQKLPEGLELEAVPEGAAGREDGAPQLEEAQVRRKIDRLRRQKTAELDPEEPALQPTPLPDVAEDMDARLRGERVRDALAELAAHVRVLPALVHGLAGLGVDAPAAVGEALGEAKDSVTTTTGS